MLQMNKHASRGCIDESSTTGNMGEDLTMDVLIVRARITEMIQVFMMRPFPSLEINFQIYKKKIKNKKNNNNYTKNLKKKNPAKLDIKYLMWPFGRTRKSKTTI